MLVIVTADGRARRWSVGTRVTIGSAATNALVLNDADVASEHATIITLVEHGVVLAHGHRVLVNGTLIEDRIEVRDGDRLTVGAHELQLLFGQVLSAPFVSTDAGTELRGVAFNPPRPRDYHRASVPPRPIVTSPEEAAFLGSLRRSPDDLEVRAVYGDWLEEHGQEARAHTLRLDRKLAAVPVGHPHERLLRARLKQHAPDEADAGWRASVSQARIRMCDLERCPKRWNALAPTNHVTVRQCGVCDRTIRFCATFREVVISAEGGEPLVVDVSLDLDEALELYRST
jgi:uncharacterized protein (TIGR02996 family)